MSGAGDEAFLRLLADAAGGGQSRVDALVALAQRTLFVPTWLPGDDAFRTVVSSAGVAALPVFVTMQSIEETSRRFGWATPDGRIPYREVGARGALGHALAQNLLVVVEMGTNHAIEIDQDEIRPLVSSASRRDPSGPFASAGKVNSEMIAAVNAREAKQSGSIPPPAGSQSVRPLTPPPGALAATAERPGGNRTPSVYPLSTAPVSIDGVTLSNLTLTPTDALLDGLSEVLRGYPEVEWACLAMLARGANQPAPAVMMRIDTAFRTRVGEITGGIGVAAQKLGAVLEVLLLDDPALMRAARSVGKPFYPWRK
ncbi:MAG: hypothetical protein IPK60_11875 [Sandaracinaceae bacterium]|nr:hypothetical protein [Sandaracinaceae bacterium]